MVAYIDDFKLMMLIALASLPLLLLLRERAPPATAGRGCRNRGGRRLDGDRQLAAVAV